MEYNTPFPDFWQTDTARVANDNMHHDDQSVVVPSQKEIRAPPKYSLHFMKIQKVVFTKSFHDYHIITLFSP